ncbi:MAG: helix-turn-helix transcriptional regulator [Pusillimonas sp.]
MADIHYSADSPFSVLTPRERDVMDYVARGKPNKIIAAELGVSQRTIEAHRARIFQKMHVRNAVELAHCVLSQRSFG